MGNHRLTNFNVAISVVSLFVLLVKMIMIIMKFFYPILGLIVSLSLTVLYAVSAYGQAGPDYADPKYPSPVPWYIAKSCSVARPFNAEKNCQIAKGAFAATIYLMYVSSSLCYTPTPPCNVSLLIQHNPKKTGSSTSATSSSPSGPCGPTRCSTCTTTTTMTPRTTSKRPKALQRASSPSSTSPLFTAASAS